MQLPPFNTALTGIGNGLQTLRHAAGEIASAETTPRARDTVESLVDLHAGQRQVEASVKVLKAADGLLGSLLDVEA